MKALVYGAVGREVVTLSPGDPVDDPHRPFTSLRLVVTQAEDQILYDVCASLTWQCSRTKSAEI